MSAPEADQLTFTNSEGMTVYLTEHQPKWLDALNDRDRVLIEALCRLVLDRLAPKKGQG